MSGISKGLRKVEVSLKWDPTPAGAAPIDLDIVAATYLAADPYGDPDYVVHFDSRSPDGTITLHRDSKDGKGFGWDEVMTLELYRLHERYARTVVGVVIQQRATRRTFSEVQRSSYRIAEDYTVLAEGDFASLPDATAATLVEFTREDTGRWGFRPTFHGSPDDPASFTRTMGRLSQGDRRP